MINRVLKWLGEGAGGGQAAANTPEEHHIAAAALLVEAATVDGHFGDDEKDLIIGLLKDKFSLSDEETADLMEAAVARQDTAPDAFRFAHQIRQSFSEAECEDILEMLWRTVLADGRVDDFEANLIRRVVGLLHMTDRAAGEARKRALSR